MGGHAWHMGVLSAWEPQLSQAISQPGGAVGFVRQNLEGQFLCGCMKASPGLGP